MNFRSGRGAAASQEKASSYDGGPDSERLWRRVTSQEEDHNARYAQGSGEQRHGHAERCRDERLLHLVQSLKRHQRTVLPTEAYALEWSLFAFYAFSISQAKSCWRKYSKQLSNWQSDQTEEFKEDLSLELFQVKFIDFVGLGVKDYRSGLDIVSFYSEATF